MTQSSEMTCLNSTLPAAFPITKPCCALLARAIMSPSVSVAPDRVSALAATESAAIEIPNAQAVNMTKSAATVLRLNELPNEPQVSVRIRYREGTGRPNGLLVTNLVCGRRLRCVGFPFLDLSHAHRFANTLCTTS